MGDASDVPAGAATLRTQLTDPAVALAGIRPARRRLRRRLWLWKVGARLEPLLDVPRGERWVASASQLVALAAMHAEAGLAEAAVDLARRAAFRDRHIHERVRYLGLSALLHRMSRRWRDLFAEDAALADAFLAQHTILRDLVEQSRGRICVVGNSPCEIGKGRGAFIDSHELVIRFNNYAVGCRYRADYGERTDIWVRGNAYETVWRRPDQRYRHVVIASNAMWRVANAQIVVAEAIGIGQSIQGLPPRTIHDLTTTLGARPSAGLKVLSYLHEILGSLEGVTVAGFSLTDQREGLTHYYPEARDSAVPHDWSAERALLGQLMGLQADGNTR